MNRKILIAALAACLALAFVSLQAAEGTGASAPGSTGQNTAVISGTVLNKNTLRYLELATVEVKGTSFQTLSAPDGSFRLAGLPAGTYTVVVGYTGLDPTTQTVVVGEGESVKADFELTSDVYVLDKYVVTSAVEGTAYAINQQRRAASIRSVTSVDAFLDTATGSPGEFVKNLSGLQMDYNQNEPQTIRIRGMDPSLTVITMDGMEVASPSDSGDVRRVMIDQLSMALIGNVEVFKAPTPDRSANAIGGLVNFNTKSAFEQKGRRASLTLGLTMDSHDFDFEKHKSPGHGDPDMRRALPIGRFEYSDSFFNNRLGIVFGMGHDDTNQLGSSERLLASFLAPSGGSLPPAGTAYTQDNVQIRRGAYSRSPNRQRRTRDDISLNTDFKVNENLSVFLKTSFTDYLSTNRNHGFTLTPATFAPGFTANEYRTTNGTFSQGVSVFEPKSTQTTTVNPGLKFISGNWRIDLAGGVSKAINRYTNPTTFTGIATRPQAGMTTDYTLRSEIGSERPTQIIINGGADPYNLANYRFSNPVPVGTAGPSSLLSNYGSTLNNNDRRSFETRWSGKLDIQRDFQGRFPFFLKAGLAYNFLHHERANHQKTWNWVGPDGVPGGVDDDMALTLFAEPPGVGKSNFPDFNLREPDYISTRKIWEYMQANPQAFWSNLAQNENHRLTNRRAVYEEVKAAYIMGNIRFDKLNVMTGLRIEHTAINTLGVRTLPTSGPNDIRLTTPGLNTTMNANSLPVVQAKYLPVRNSSGYRSKPFPYLHLRYEWLPQLQTRASYTEAIGRPSFSQILPNVTQNDGNPPSISFNPAGLKPQRSKNLDFSIEYYTKTAGEWTASWFSRDVVDYISTSRVLATDILPPEVLEAMIDNGFDPTLFPGYEIRTTTNLGTAKWTGYELGMRQKMRDWKFVPEVLHGVEIWANYTKLYKIEGTFGADAALIQAGTAPLILGLANTVPLLYNYGISYRTPRGKFFVQISTNYQTATTQSNITAATQVHSQTNAYQFWNGEATYKITPKLRFTATARNLLGERKETSQVGVVTERQQDTGIAWVFTLKYDL